MYANESVSTNLKRDLKADKKETLSLKSMYNVHMNEDALKKYEEQYDQLKHVNKNAEKLRGCMYFWQGELVAFVSIELRSGKTWIDTLEVVKQYRGRHLSSQLLDVAVKKFGATDLRVHKDNEKAIGIFKTYGFKTYDKKGSWLYMTLREDASKIEPKEDEKSHPITDNLRSEEVEKNKPNTKSANESGGLNMNYDYNDQSLDTFLDVANESIFGKKSVEDLLKHARKKLIRSLKTESQCDIYLEQIKNESKKFNEAVSTLMSVQAKFAAGKIDKKEMKKTVSSAVKLLNNNCKMLNVRLGDVVDDTKAITRQDIASFASYVKGLNGIVKEIKTARKKNIAIESTVEFDENDAFFEAIEGVDLEYGKYKYDIRHRGPSFNEQMAYNLSDIATKKLDNHLYASDSKGDGYTAAKMLVKKIEKTEAKLVKNPDNAKLKSQLKELKMRLDVVNKKRKAAGYFAITESAYMDDYAFESAQNNLDLDIGLDLDSLFTMESTASDDLILGLSIDGLMALEAADLPEDDEDSDELKEELKEEKKNEKKKSKKKSKKDDDEDDDDSCEKCGDEDCDGDCDDEDDDEDDEYFDDAEEASYKVASKRNLGDELRKAGKRLDETRDEYEKLHEKYDKASRARSKCRGKREMGSENNRRTTRGLGDKRYSIRRDLEADFNKEKHEVNKKRDAAYNEYEKAFKEKFYQDRVNRNLRRKAKAGYMKLKDFNSAKEASYETDILDVFDYSPEYDSYDDYGSSNEDLFD